MSAKPRQLFLEDFSKGQTYPGAPRKITEADVLSFAAITGDAHPLHCDDAYARSTRFGRPIVHGLHLMALTALGATPRRVFLALGRKEVGSFERAPWHFYLVRSVDPITPPPALPKAVYVIARGPFTEAGDRDLMESERIDVVVSRNSGGGAAYGKIAAARALAIPVIMVRRPLLPDAPSAKTVADAMRWVDHVGAGSTDRGV